MSRLYPINSASYKLYCVTGVVHALVYPYIYCAVDIPRVRAPLEHVPALLRRCTSSASPQYMLPDSSIVHVPDVRVEVDARSGDARTVYSGTARLHVELDDRVFVRHSIPDAVKPKKASVRRSSLAYTSRIKVLDSRGTPAVAFKRAVNDSIAVPPPAAITCSVELDGPNYNKKFADAARRVIDLTTPELALGDVRTMLHLPGANKTASIIVEDLTGERLDPDPAIVRLHDLVSSMYDSDFSDDDAGPSAPI